jgi:hypothetical protein
MSEPSPTAMPFVGSDRRSEILDRLAARARETPPATTPEAIASRVAASVQNQMNESSSEDDGEPYAKPKIPKDSKDADKDRKDLLDGRGQGKDEKDNKDDKDDKDKEASDKEKDDKEKEASEKEKDDKEKEASDKDKELGKDDKDDKDIKDGQDAKGPKDGKDDKDDYDAGKTDDQDNGGKGDTDTGTYTAEADELGDPNPASHGQPGETSGSKPPAGDTGRPTSLLTRLPVV